MNDNMNEDTTEETLMISGENLNTFIDIYGSMGMLTEHILESCTNDPDRPALPTVELSDPETRELVAFVGVNLQGLLTTPKDGLALFLAMLLESINYCGELAAQGIAADQND